MTPESIRATGPIYRWPGNVRELENLVQHMTILYSGQRVGYNELPEKYQGEEAHSTASPNTAPKNGSSQESMTPPPEQLPLFSPASGPQAQEMWPKKVLTSTPWSTTLKPSSLSRH